MSMRNGCEISINCTRKEQVKGVKTAEVCGGIYKELSSGQWIKNECEPNQTKKWLQPFTFILLLILAYSWKLGWEEAHLTYKWDKIQYYMHQYVHSDSSLSSFRPDLLDEDACQSDSHVRSQGVSMCASVLVLVLVQSIHTRIINS